jgi:hypothetical protein
MAMPIEMEDKLLDDTQRIMVRTFRRADSMHGSAAPSSRAGACHQLRGQSLMAVSPEFWLAAACAMWPPSDRRIGAIRAAASEVLDWPPLSARSPAPSGARTGQPAIAQEIGAQSAQVVTRKPGDGHGNATAATPVR